MLAISPEIAALLLPISPEQPMGKNIEYDQVYDDIRHARESDPNYLPQDEWTISEPRSADWEKVRKLCETALTQQSKDLQLGCWFVEALTHLKGMEGTEIGVRFLQEFITRFWFQCWPQLDEDGATFRYSKLIRLDRDVSQTLYNYPLFRQPESTLAHWCKVLAFEHKVSTWPDSRDEFIAKDGDLTIQSFDNIAASFSSIEISQQAERLKLLQETLASLENNYLSLSHKEPHTLFSLTRQTLSDIADFLQRLAQRITSVGDTVMDRIDSDVSHETHMPFKTEVLSRDLAIRQMLLIADYFRQKEPSSPVPFLMERAARWANMTLTEWLDEMLTDSGSLREINNVLKGQEQ